MWKYSFNNNINKHIESFLNLSKKDKLRYLTILNNNNHFLFNFYLNIYNNSQINSNIPKQNTTQVKNNTEVYNLQDRINKLKQKLYKTPQNNINISEYRKERIENEKQINYEQKRIKEKLTKDTNHIQNNSHVKNIQNQQYLKKLKMEAEKQNRINQQNIIEAERERNLKEEQNRVKQQNMIEAERQRNLKEEQNRLKEQNMIEERTEKIRSKTSELVKYQEINLLEKMVENKRVIVVGPAAYLNFMENGSFIDSFDIVVRINRGSLLNPSMEKKIGKKIDILFSNLNILDKESSKFLDTNYLKNMGTKLIFCTYPKIRPFIEDQQSYYNLYGNTFPVETIDLNFYLNIHAALNTRPNTGILAILTLLRMNLKSLYVTGFSFYNDGYYSGYNDRRNNRNLKREITKYHNQSSQQEIVKKIFLNNDKIFLDKTIISLLFPYFMKIFNNINQIPFDKMYKYLIEREACKLNNIIVNSKRKVLFLNKLTNNFDMNQSKKYDIVFYYQKELLNKIKNGVYICQEINDNFEIHKEYTITFNQNSKKDKKNYILYNVTIVNWIINNIFKMNSRINWFDALIYSICMCGSKKAKTYFIKNDNKEESEYLNFLEKMGMCSSI